MWSSNSTFMYIPNRNENIFIHENVYTDAYGRISHNNNKKPSTKCPSTDECVNKMLNNHVMQYHLGKIRDEVLICIARWINLENIKLCERNQSENNIYCMFPFTLNVQNEHINRDRKQISGYLELGGWRNGEFINGSRVLLGSDEYILMLACGDGCPTLSIY